MRTRTGQLRLSLLTLKHSKLSIARGALAEVLVSRIAQALLLTRQGDERLARWAAYSLRVWVSAAEDLIGFILERTLIVRRRT